MDDLGGQSAGRIQLAEGLFVVRLGTGHCFGFGQAMVKFGAYDLDSRGGFGAFAVEGFLFLYLLFEALLHVFHNLIY